MQYEMIQDELESFSYDLQRKRYIFLRYNQNDRL